MATDVSAVRSTRPLGSYAFAASGTVIAVLVGTGALGSLGQILVDVLGVVAAAMIPLGVRHFRPTRRLPWGLLFAGVVILLVGAVLHSAMNTLGDLSPNRPILPDAVAIPGYVLIGIALTLLARSGDPSDRFSFDVTLDGLIAMLAFLTVAWVYMIEPAFESTGMPLLTRILMTSFPPMDVYLVMVAFRVGFDRNARRATAGRFLTVAVVMLLVNDSLFSITDLHVLRVSLNLIDLWGLLAVTCLGAAALHPSMRQLGPSVRRRASGPHSIPTSGRLILVAGGLVVPTLVVATDRDHSMSSGLVVGLIAVAAALAATLRLFRALRVSASSEARLAHQATHDELTGLPNRALAERWITQVGLAGLAGGGTAVVFLDVDRFKLINDTFGHSHGDLLLSEVAQRLEATLGPKDFVARIGGDEFVIVLVNVADATAARRSAERIRKCFERAFVLGESEVFVSASLGVSMMSAGDDCDSETLIRDADTAMYQAKEAGRDTVAIFDTSMRDRIADRLSLEHDLRLAVERAEFRLMYQPIISYAATGPRVVGIEALLRWDGPTRGLVPPGVFISIAEDSGLIVPIGDWVIQEACRMLAQWRQEPGMEDLFVSVNVSALQLKKASLMPRIRMALAQSRLSPDSLCVELTESLLMESPADGSALLARLRELGVRLALDDFGTGYSSLAYLRQFPVDFVKVDKSFIDGLAQPDSSEETLVAAIVAMARALGATTIAEGVEEPQQEDRLRQIGADCAQGYYYARPVDSDRVVETIRGLMPARGLRLVSGDAL